MTDRDRRRLNRCAFGFAACMFALAGLARFIEPGGWAVWAAVGLLALALVFSVGAAKVMHDVDRKEDER